MNKASFDTLVENELTRIKELLEQKGADYSAGGDRLSNFKENGKALGLNHEVVWGVYASKHWNAICKYIRDGELESEPIETRIHDMINYLLLLRALIAEERGEIIEKMPF